MAPHTGAEARVHAPDLPAIVDTDQFDFPCADELRSLDVDQTAPKQVLAQQDFARAAFEQPEIQFGGRRAHCPRFQLRDPLNRHEKLAPRHAGAQTGHRRQTLAAIEPGDHVHDPSELSPVGVQ